MKPTVVILAGGIGRRFRPFQISKPLYPMLGKSLIERTVHKAQKAGFEKFLIVTNPNDQADLDVLFSQNNSIKTIIQQNPTGMGNALLSVEKEVGEQPVLVLNATDQVNQSLFEEMAKKASANNPFIVAIKVKKYFHGGYVVRENNKAVAVIEKPGEGNEPSDLVNLVFHYFPNAQKMIEFVGKVPANTDNQYEQALSAHMKQTPFDIIEYDGYWQATKYPWDILSMTELLLNEELIQNKHAGKISPSAHIDQNVYLGKNVVIHENATIKGPSYIGDNTIVGNNAFIRSSYIGENCVVGTNSEVARSYIGKGCWLHQNYVGDSVLESNVAMGAGTVTANFRLDEKNILFDIDHQKIDTQKTHLGALIAADVRIGVNVSLMPGIKIGHNCIIGPTCLINENVDRFTRVISESTLKKVPFKGTINKRK